MTDIRDTEPFNPRAWDGDAEKLIGNESRLVYDEDACERAFMSKHEAFCAGLALGANAGGVTPGSEHAPDVGRRERIDSASELGAQADGFA